MADQSKKVQLQTTSGVKLYPRTSVDNIVTALGSTVSALVTTISSGTAASDLKIPTEKAVSTALSKKIHQRPYSLDRQHYRIAISA